MLEKMGAFNIITFLLSFVLGVICIYYIIRILLSKRIVIKVMEESLGEAATSKSIIAMVCIVLALFSISFFAVCVAIYFFTFAIH